MIHFGLYLCNLAYKKAPCFFKQEAKTSINNSDIINNAYKGNKNQLPGELSAVSSAGEVDVSTGFMKMFKSLLKVDGNAASGYRIEDGKITYPVKGATLIGSGSEVLMKIDMIANDLKRAQGMCGSSSGSIPTDVGQPTIRVQNMTVGGRG